jgi:hypothetical protein
MQFGEVLYNKLSEVDISQSGSFVLEHLPVSEQREQQDHGIANGNRGCSICSRK